MAYMLGAEKVKVEFPTKDVFESVSLGVNEGDRIGIVGRNGDGKSTLLALLAGVLEPDEGRVLKNGSIRVGILKQIDDLDPQDSVGHAIVGDMPEYEWAADAGIRDILAGLVSDLDWNAEIKTLSGGQRRRVDLARLLIGQWDILALDEPTNHLDVRAINWLAHHLKTRWRAGSGALLVVTHDRWFLDEVCNEMWEVHDKVVDPFEGGYSAYIQQRVERDRLAAVAEEKRQNTLRRELAWLARGPKARGTKPKFRVDAAQALIADVPPLRNELELKRMAMTRLGKQVVELKDVTLAFPGSEPLLSHVDWIVGPGDRYGLVGSNGVGKTSLLKLIEGKLEPTSGLVKIGKTVRFAVLSQHLDNLVALGNDRVREVIARYSRRVMLDGKEYSPAKLLEKLGFNRADLNEPVCDLSGGQKRRLALMLILLDEPNVLILDEPGNDMDTDMLVAIESLLDGWPGTLLLVTHDRYLMERVTDHQYAIIDGKIQHLPRGVDEYIEIEEARRESRSLPKNAPGTKMADDEGVVTISSLSPTVGASSQLEAAAVSTASTASKLSGGEIRALRKTIESSERKMDTLRKKIDEAKLAMTKLDPTDFVALTSAQEEINDLQNRLSDLELEWLEASEALGE